MRTIGLVGNHRGTLIRMIQERGISVIDVDRISNTMLLEGSSVYEVLLSKYGKDCVSNYGSLNASWIKTNISSDHNKALELRGIVTAALLKSVEGIMNSLEKNNVTEVVVSYSDSHGQYDTQISIGPDSNSEFIVERNFDNAVEILDEVFGVHIPLVEANRAIDDGFDILELIVTPRISK